MSILGMLLWKQYNILAFLPEAVLVIDETGKILYANKSAQKLFEIHKIKHKNINEYFFVNLKTEYKQIVNLTTESKNTKIIDVKVADISSKRNKRYVLTLSDNTKEHSLINELMSEKQGQNIINHDKNLLLSKMENYLTSPLHSITGFSQAMLSDLCGVLNEKQRKYIDIINANSSELLLLLQKLVELSQIESDFHKFDFKNFDIPSLLSVVINELQVKSANKDIKIFANPTDIINVYSDKNAVKIILTNLIENALELMETGTISIEVKNPPKEFIQEKGLEDVISEKSYMMCEIICNGIDENIYNDTDIFNPYIQVDKNSKKYLLQSLLFSCTQKYIKKLKGDIWVNNRLSNQVSFIFIIPTDKILVEA